MHLHEAKFDLLVKKTQNAGNLESQPGNSRACTAVTYANMTQQTKTPNLEKASTLVIATKTKNRKRCRLWFSKNSFGFGSRNFGTTC